MTNTIECNVKKALFSTAVLMSIIVLATVARAQETIEASPQVQSISGSTASDARIATTGSTDSPSRAAREVTLNSPSPVAPESVKRSVESAALSPLAPTSMYLVGIGDVLDIQLRNSPIRESTLFSVSAGGMLDYPLAGDPIMAVGLTTEEIGAKLASRVKIYEKPRIIVTVREYSSHNVIVTGLVHDPGTKSLRREAVPLFILLAESRPRADAGLALIMREGSPLQTIDIFDADATSVLVYANDVIRLVSAPPPVPLYFYIAGQIAMPGQRDFHAGMTLTQSIFASGGLMRSAGSKARVMRQGTDGRLVSTDYNLKRIEQGKDPDPQIQAGDRIEINR